MNKNRSKVFTVTYPKVNLVQVCFVPRRGLNHQTKGVSERYDTLASIEA